MAETPTKAPPEKSAAAAAGGIDGAPKDGSAPGKAAAAAQAAKEKLRKSLGHVKGVFGSVSGRFSSSLAAIARLPIQLLKVLFNSLVNLFIRGDLMTKFLVLGFAAGIALVLFTSSEIYTRYFKRTDTGDVAGGHGGKKAEIAADFDVFLKARQSRLQAIENLVFLEGFSADLPAGKGEVKVFEVEVFVECDRPETAAWVKAHISQTKETVSTVLQSKTYEQIITKEGKDRLKGEIVTSLNALIHKSFEGKVKRAYFSHLIMGT
ncbi:MAG: flagellar basal body-associated FliL family protein [Deltaproteobacteria bacterium]|nr:flagellar basal body-associated FliL family protein [Deltaproteobacteria bacterium]